MKKLIIAITAVVVASSLAGSPAFARKGADDGCAANDCGVDNHGVNSGKHGKHGKKGRGKDDNGKHHHGPNHT